METARRLRTPWPRSPPYSCISALLKKKKEQQRKKVETSMFIFFLCVCVFLFFFFRCCCCSFEGVQVFHRKRVGLSRIWKAVCVCVSYAFTNEAQKAQRRGKKKTVWNESKKKRAGAPQRARRFKKKKKYRTYTQMLSSKTNRKKLETHNE